MANKQPFYHRVDGLLFTATQEVTKKDFLKTLKSALKPFGAIASSFEIEDSDGYAEPEPGDPADLI